MPEAVSGKSHQPIKNIRDVELREWDPQNEMCPYAIVVAVGKKGSGKTFGFKNLMYLKSKLIENVTVYSESSDLNCWFEDHMPAEYIHNTVNLDHIKKYIEFYKSTFKPLDPQQQKELRASRKMDHLFIMDDVSASSALWRNSAQIGALATQSRWLCTDVWVTSQNVIAGVPPCLRENADYTLIYRHSKPHEREQLFKHYSGGIPTQHIFNQLMDQLTEDYECMVINNKTTSNKLEDMVHFWKAEPTPPFRMGTKMDRYVSRLRHIETPSITQYHISPLNSQKRKYDDLQQMIEHYTEAKRTRKIRLTGKGIEKMEMTNDNKDESILNT